MFINICTFVNVLCSIKSFVLVFISARVMQEITGYILTQCCQIMMGGGWVGKPTINLNPWKWTLTVEFFHTRWFILILCFSSTLMIAFVQIIFTFPKGILSASTVPNFPQFYCIVANYVIRIANNHSFVLQYVVGNMSSLFWWKIQMHNIAPTVEWFEGKRHHQKRKSL